MMYKKHFLIDFILNLPENGQIFDNHSFAEILGSIGKMNPLLFVNIVNSIANYDKEVERAKKIYTPSDYEYEIKNRTVNKLDLFRPYSFCSYFSDIFDNLFEHYGKTLPDEIISLFSEFETSYFVTSELKKEFKEKLVQSVFQSQTIHYTQAIEKHIERLVHLVPAKKILDMFKYNHYLSYTQLFHSDNEFIAEQNNFLYPSLLKNSWSHLNKEDKEEQLHKHIQDICQPVLYNTYSTLYLDNDELNQLYKPLSFINKVGLDYQIFIKTLKENYELKKHGLSLGDKKIKKFTLDLFESVIHFYCNAQTIPQSFFDVCKELNIHVGHSLYYLPHNQTIAHFIEQEMSYDKTELIHSIEEHLNKNKTRQNDILEYLFDTHFESYTKLFELKSPLLTQIKNNEKYKQRLPQINNLISLLQLQAQLENKEKQNFIPEKLKIFLSHLKEVNIEKESLFLLPLNYQNISNKEAIKMYEQWHHITKEEKDKYHLGIELYKADIEKTILSYQMNMATEPKAKIKL